MKQKILFIMPAMLNGGAEKVLIDILKNFDYSLFEVTLLLETKDGPYVDDIPGQVKLIYLHKKNLWIERLYRYLIMFHCKWLVYLILCRLPILWYTKGLHFDTIISFMEGMAVKMHSYIFNKADNNISWVHIDLKKKHWSLDFFENENEELECYRRMDNIVFVSQDAKNRFKELFEVDENKLKVIYNLIDCHEIVRLSQCKLVEKKKFTICMVGRLNKQKRYDRALEVASKLRKNGYDLEFWVLGDGELKTELEYEIYRLGLQGSFLLLGFVKQPYSYINQADILFLCSESEGFSLVVCEALCLGKPVVSTCTSGPTELISKSRGGIIVNEDIDSIYNGLKQMIDNKPFREECSTNAVAFSKTFSVQETMQRIYDLI